jgi:hypothetical protein
MFIYCGYTFVAEGHTADSTSNGVTYFFWFNTYSPYLKMSEIQSVDPIEVSMLYNAGQLIH